MLLIAVNYPKEINKKFFQKYDDIKIKTFHQKKGMLFVLRLQKYILENTNIDMVLVWGSSGGQNKDQIGNIYHITRSFLWNSNTIIDSQQPRFNSLKFNNIKTTNIVTKFRISKHTKKLYDFGSIYDIESFWVAQLSNQIGTPIFIFKGVTDTNKKIFMNKNEQIDYLLDPTAKRKHNQIVYSRLKDNFDKINNNFQDFFDKEFIKFYRKYSTSSQYRKDILC